MPTPTTVETRVKHHHNCFLCFARVTSVNAFVSNSLEASIRPKTERGRDGSLRRRGREGKRHELMRHLTDTSSSVLHLVFPFRRLLHRLAEHPLLIGIQWFCAFVGAFIGNRKQLRTEKQKI